MANNGKWICLVVILLLTISIGTALASDGATSKGTRSDRTTDISHKFITGNEDGVAPFSYATGASRPSSRPGVVAQVGITWYDYQHNGSMGRQVVYDGVGNYVHFLWMYKPIADDGGNDRGAAYNAWTHPGGGMEWSELAGGGKLVSEGGTTAKRAGYVSIDVTDWGAAVASFHEAVGFAANARADFDTWIPFGYFDSLGSHSPLPPTCEGWVTGGCETGGDYIWPIVDWDKVGDDSITHVATIESPDCGDAGEIQTIAYYRKVNNAWPHCATGIDSVYNISQVVRSDPNSDKVAIVYLKPMYYTNPPDPMDECEFTQWQNDVVYKESTNGGVSFTDQTATFVNVTDYSEGHTLRSDQIVHMAYTDVSAVYDSYGRLHVVWNTPVRNMEDACGGLPYASRMWHWDDFNQCISLVYDATRPAAHCRHGAFMHTIGKMSVSECAVDDTTRLYVSFSRMGAHTTADGDTNADCSDQADFGNFANSDIYVTGSSDGGLTWGSNPAHPLYSVAGPNSGPVQNGSAVNLTNTQTDDCLPGDCMSEHWGTMSKYNVDSLHLMWVEDHDAGGGIRGTTAGDEEGLQTENPMQYAREGCFAPNEICGVSATPVDVAVIIAPTTGTGCTVPTTKAFDIMLTNTGNQPVNFTAAANQTFISPANTGGTIGVGCNGSTTLNYTAGPVAVEGQYEATITVNANCGGDPIVLVIDVTVNVDCFPAEYATLSTACWSVAVWNTARAGGDGTGEEGQMYWFIDQIALMFDESIIITFADDTCQSYFSMFDGSNSEMSLVSTSPLVIEDMGYYEHASAEWATGDYQYDQVNDPAIVGTIDYYLPKHPDTCVLIEKIRICNNTDTTVRIHIGEGIDWDIADYDDELDDVQGADACDKDESRQMVYQYGGRPAEPEAQYYGGVSFMEDIVGAIVVENDSTIYPNGGYQPCLIGGLLRSHTGFTAVTPDTAQDLNSVYVIAKDVELAKDSCVCFIKVKTSTLLGLDSLKSKIDKGKDWVTNNGITCVEPGECDAVIGDANGSGGPTPIDIDDVVYLIAYIFSGGPEPTPYPEASGDANCSCPPTSVDIDDVVYLIAYIFSGGPPPCSCEDWVASCGPLQ